MTGFDSKREMAMDKAMTRPIEADYTSQVAYTRALELFCDTLAQPEQEPVAYCYVQKGTSVDILTFDDAPDDAVDGTIFPLYTAPPKREWVGLTEQDMPGGEDPMFDHQYFIAGMVYASTFLKEKNT